MTLIQAGNWQGNMLDIGPLYPGVGTEWLLVIIGFVVWIGWHIWQFRMENKNYENDLETLKQKGNLERALKGERIL